MVDLTVASADASHESQAHMFQGNHFELLFNPEQITGR
jgi:hypothetical protein